MLITTKCETWSPKNIDVTKTKFLQEHDTKHTQFAYKLGKDNNEDRIRKLNLRYPQLKSTLIINTIIII